MYILKETILIIFFFICKERKTILVLCSLYCHVVKKLMKLIFYTWFVFTYLNRFYYSYKRDLQYNEFKDQSAHVYEKSMNIVSISHLTKRIKNKSSIHYLETQMTEQHVPQQNWCKSQVFRKGKKILLHLCTCYVARMGL